MNITNRKKILIIRNRCVLTCTNDINYMHISVIFKNKIVTFYTFPINYVCT